MRLCKIDEGIIYGSNKPKQGDKSSYMPYLCEQITNIMEKWL